jgi:ABC-type transport system substrate-binding protein
MRWIRTTLDALAAGLALGAATLVAGPLACAPSLAAPIPSAHGDDAAPRRGGTLHLASLGDIVTLDPAGALNGLSLPAAVVIFAGLVDYDAHARPVADLAERWEIEDAGRTYRFVLRSGVTMHDGTELTADDVKRSVERALHPSSPDPNASYFTNIAGYDAYATGKADHLEGVTVDGKYVVTFHLKEADPVFIYLMAMPTLRPTCKSAGARYVDTWLPCGAGPFKLQPGGWQRGTTLRLVRHEGYFRPGRPYLDAVEWTFNMQALPQRLRFERGELDVVRDLTQSDVSRFAADARWRPLGVTDFDTRVYGESMNTRIPPFDNVEIRRAVAAAIDREQYRLLSPQRMSAMTQALPASLADFDPSFAGQRYDYAAALEHMRKGGYPYDPATGVGGWPRPIPYVLSDTGILTSTAQLLQQDLARIGLRIELKLVSYSAFLAISERAGGAAMSPGNWELDYPDPSAVIDPLFTSGAITPESSFNTAFYSNPRLDALVERAHREMDAKARRALYAEANAILCDDAPWAFTFGYHFFTLHQPYVHGLAPHPVWPIDVSGVWLDRTGDELDQALGRGTR